MDPVRWVVYGFIRTVFAVVCKVDKRDLDKIPYSGPLIVYSNHTGSIEVPLVFVYLQPRPVTGWAKVETWNNALIGWLFDLWGAIPIRRGEADMEAIKKAIGCLDEGMILGISPEGTRNRDGRLRKAHPGIVTLALHSNAPLLPLAHWGGEKFSTNLKKLKRTDFVIRVGKPVKLQVDGMVMDRKTRQKIADELMYKLAIIMPEEYRGEYTDLSQATTNYISEITSPA